MPFLSARPFVNIPHSLAQSGPQCSTKLELCPRVLSGRRAMQLSAAFAGAPASGARTSWDLVVKDQCREVERDPEGDILSQCQCQPPVIGLPRSVWYGDLEQADPRREDIVPELSISRPARSLRGDEPTQPTSRLGGGFLHSYGYAFTWAKGEEKRGNQDPKIRCLQFRGLGIHSLVNLRREISRNRRIPSSTTPPWGRERPNLSNCDHTARHFLSFSAQEDNRGFLGNFRF
jgi:hypothetical protein